LSINVIIWLKRIGVTIGIVLVAVTAWLWFIVNDIPKALEPKPFEPAGVLFNNVCLLSMDPEAPVRKMLRQCW